MASTSGASVRSVWLSQYFALSCLTQKYNKYTIKVIYVQERIVENRKYTKYTIESLSTCVDDCF